MQDFAYDGMWKESAAIGMQKWASFSMELKMYKSNTATRQMVRGTLYQSSQHREYAAWLQRTATELEFTQKKLPLPEGFLLIYYQCLQRFGWLLPEVLTGRPGCHDLKKPLLRIAQNADKPEHALPEVRNQIPVRAFTYPCFFSHCLRSSPPGYPLREQPTSIQQTRSLKVQISTPFRQH